MPYLQMAAVVPWKVNDLGKVVPGTPTSISVVVQDTGNPDSRIIAAYLREELKKQPGRNADELLKEAQDGLLTVTATNRFEVTAPPLPADYPQGPTATIAKALRDAIAEVTAELRKGGGGQPGPAGAAPPGPAGAATPGPAGTAPPGPAGAAPPGPAGAVPPGPTGTAPPGPTGTAPPGPAGAAPPGPTGTAPPGPTGTAPPGPAGGAQPDKGGP